MTIGDNKLGTSTISFVAFSEGVFGIATGDSKVGGGTSLDRTADAIS
jgi:hypothetical protein